MKRDMFRNTLQSGSNLETLHKVNEFFRGRFGFGVYRYEYVSAPSRGVNIEFLSKEDLRTCCICGTRLYANDSDFDDDGAPFAEVRSKKYMRFLAGDGSWKYTCHGVSRCLKKAKFTPDLDNAVFGITVPSYSEFISYEGDDSDEYYLFSKEDYESRVSPFIKKWLATPVNKSNVREFIFDLEECLIHLNRYEERSWGKVKARIFQLIGV